jgi:FtsP/CotA-like multicopper oxidase with cupredoxin domain
VKISLLLVSLLALATIAFAARAEAQTRTYYIAADEVIWNYAPSGMDRITGKPLPKAPPVFVGYKYKKAIYREYTDATFTKLKPRSAQWQHLGILGPLIRAEVGDTIKVVFKNNAHHPYSVHPHGVLYLKASEGAPYQDGVPASQKRGSAVPPGATFTYTWQVPERAGPGPSDPSSILWFYHSHANEVADMGSGLIGPIIITRKGDANPDGTPKGVDREFVTMFSVDNENRSHYYHDNVGRYVTDKSMVPKRRDEDYPFALFYLSNEFMSINGLTAGNLPGLRMKRGEHVRWYLLSDASDDFNYHVVHWHGQTVLMNGNRSDMVELLPASMRVADMVPDNPGTWWYHCHVPAHLMFGMSALFTVTP